MCWCEFNKHIYKNIKFYRMTLMLGSILYLTINRYKVIGPAYLVLVITNTKQRVKQGIVHVSHLKKGFYWLISKILYKSWRGVHLQATAKWCDESKFSNLNRLTADKGRLSDVGVVELLLPFYSLQNEWQKMMMTLNPYTIDISIHFLYSSFS